MGLVRRREGWRREMKREKLTANYSDTAIRVVQRAAEAVQAAVDEGAAGAAGGVDVCHGGLVVYEAAFIVLGGHSKTAARTNTVAAATWTTCETGSVGADAIE